MIGNATVIYVILSDKKMREKTHNQLLLNLAVSDFGLAVIVYPFTTTACYLGRWPFGTGSSFKYLKRMSILGVFKKVD